MPYIYTVSKGGESMASEKVKSTIRFNNELKTKLQQKAKEEDLSLNQLVVKACKKLIKEMERKKCI